MQLQDVAAWLESLPGDVRERLPPLPAAVSMTSSNRITPSHPHRRENNGFTLAPPPSPPPPPPRNRAGSNQFLRQRPLSVAWQFNCPILSPSPRQKNNNNNNNSKHQIQMSRTEWEGKKKKKEEEEEEEEEMTTDWLGS